MAGKTSKGKENGSSVKEKIQASIEEAELHHKRELFRRRIDLARHGLKYYQQKKVVEAVKAFHTYLRIVEEWKGVPEGKLTPSLFSQKEELAELVLLNAIYWDLTKLYDRTKSDRRQNEFQHYMDKFILFTKGMSFQPVVAETVRKYIVNEKPVHREKFKQAYANLGGSNCFVATALLDVTDERTLIRLRKYRDSVLLSSRTGRFAVRAYYLVGPLLARGSDELPRFARRGLGRCLDRLAAALTGEQSRSCSDGRSTGFRRS